VREPSTLGRVTRALTILVIATAASWLFSCGGNSSSSPSPTGRSSISGVVSDPVSGGPLAGATVSIQAKSVTAGADGRYSITGLEDGAATLTVQHQGHRNVTQTVTIAGATTRNITMTVALETRAAGPWAGTWTNNALRTSGSLNMMLTVNTVAQTMTMNLNVSGPGFGNPSTDTLTGAYSPTTGADFTTTSSLFGNVTFRWPPNLGISGNAVNLPGGTVSRVDFLGELNSPDRDLILDMRGNITFANGNTGTSTFTLTCARRSSTSSCS
jgi:hypothetical protein